MTSALARSNGSNCSMWRSEHRFFGISILHAPVVNKTDHGLKPRDPHGVEVVLNLFQASLGNVAVHEHPELDAVTNQRKGLRLARSARSCCTWNGAWGISVCPGLPPPGGSIGHQNPRSGLGKTERSSWYCTGSAAPANATSTAACKLPSHIHTPTTMVLAFIQFSLICSESFV